MSCKTFINGKFIISIYSFQQEHDTKNSEKCKHAIWIQKTRLINLEIAVWNIQVSFGNASWWPVKWAGKLLTARMNHFYPIFSQEHGMEN